MDWAGSSQAKRNELPCRNRVSQGLVGLHVVGHSFGTRAAGSDCGLDQIADQVARDSLP